MWSETWIGLGALLWLFGFFRARYVDEKKSPIERSLVRPPFLVYLLCGLPKARNLPRGVMAMVSIIGQLQGISFIVYGMIYHYWPNQNFTLHGFLLFSGMILFFIYGWTLYKQHPYKTE
jgi:hypothetical protein